MSEPTIDSTKAYWWPTRDEHLKVIQWASEQEALLHFRRTTRHFPIEQISEPVNYHPRLFEVRVIVGGSLKILDWDLGLAAAVLNARIDKILDRLKFNC